MAQIQSAEDVKAMLKRTADLPPNQRVVVLLYAASRQNERTGAVMATGQDLAAEIDMNPSLFSRLRLALTRSGWLEKVSDSSPYYRLTPKADGDNNVLPLRRAGGDGEHQARRA